MPIRRRCIPIGALTFLIAATACRPEVQPAPREAASAAWLTSVSAIAANAPTNTSVVDTAVVPVGNLILADAVDSLFVQSLPEELSHRLYQHWAPDTTEEHACSSIDEDGYELQAAWGIARIHLLTLHDARYGHRSTAGAPGLRQAVAKLEVVRVVSLEGDPKTSDGKDYAGDLMVVQPIIDTIQLQWHRRDGAWHSCWPTWLAHDPASPISIVGPNFAVHADSSKKARRREPSDASWERARAIADSVGKAGAEVSIDHPKLPKPVQASP